MHTENSIASTVAKPVDASVPWLETQAEVTACRYEFARTNTLSFGIATKSNQFVVSFSYYAHAKTFRDEFTSLVAPGNGETFPVFYNPLNPQQNRRSELAPTGRVPLFVFGIAGSIVISLLYIVMMGGHSTSPVDSDRFSACSRYGAPSLLSRWLGRPARRVETIASTRTKRALRSTPPSRGDMR